MARRDAGPDFSEALARGLDVIRAFRPHPPVMSLTAVAGAAGLARPTARRVLLTPEQPVRLRDGDRRVIAALNVTVHAAQAPVQTLTGEYLPLLLRTAGAISADWARYQSVAARHRAAARSLDSQDGRQQTADRRTSVRAADNRIRDAQPGTITIRPEDSISGQQWSERR